LVDRSRRWLAKQLVERKEHPHGSGDQLVDGCKRTRVRKAKINTSGCP
jgi:hypothetical protein